MSSIGTRRRTKYPRGSHRAPGLVRTTTPGQGRPWYSTAIGVLDGPTEPSDEDQAVEELIHLETV